MHKWKEKILSSIASVEWVLTLILKYLRVTITTFTQCGPVEDHSWHNEVQILCDIFNLNQNNNYEAATAIAVDVLGNSYMHSKLSSKAIQSILVKTLILTNMEQMDRQY